MTTNIEQGYSACAGLGRDGWFGGALVLKGCDQEFLTVPKGLSYEQRVNYARRWAQLTVNPSREIALILPCDAALSTRCIASADRMEGPVAPREIVANPTLAWIERRAGQYRLVVFENDEVRTILTRNHVLRSPQAQTPCVGDESGTLCECDTPPVGSDNRPTGDGARGACGPGPFRQDLTPEL